MANFIRRLLKVSSDPSSSCALKKNTSPSSEEVKECRVRRAREVERRMKQRRAIAVRILKEKDPAVKAALRVRLASLPEL